MILPQIQDIHGFLRLKQAKSSNIQGFHGLNTQQIHIVFVFGFSKKLLVKRHEFLHHMNLKIMEIMSWCGFS